MKKVKVPIGKLGEWKVERFPVTRKAAVWMNLRNAFNPQRGDRSIEPGIYTRLVRNRNTLVMSDTPAEMRDAAYFIREARGHVLINGLGLGAVLNEVMVKEEVKSINVVEISEELIQLVGKHFQNGKVDIVHANAFHYNPREYMRTKGIEKFDWVWHDIWDSFSEDFKPQVHKLNRRYAHWCHNQDNWMSKGLPSMMR